MSHLTARKRATGHGSAREGTSRHWAMTKSSVALLILAPIFVFTFGPMLGQPHAAVTEYFARPFPALVAALTLAVGFLHFKSGIRMVVEDYVHGYSRELTLILLTCLSYGAAATGVFAIARIAL